MSQMLGRIFKLSSSARNRGLCLRGQVHEQRLFSTAAAPYLLLRKNNAVLSSGGGRFMSIDLFDPRKQETVKIPEQRVSKEIQRSVIIGSSRGWVGLKNLLDSNVLLTIVGLPFLVSHFTFMDECVSNIDHHNLARLCCFGFSGS